MGKEVLEDFVKLSKMIEERDQEIRILKLALLKASKEAFGNKVSFISSNYPKRITNANEYAEYLLFEAKEVADE